MCMCLAIAEFGYSVIVKMDQRLSLLMLLNQSTDNITE